MRPKFEICGKIYTTKISLLNDIKKILNSYNLDDTINDTDKKIIVDLLKYHTEYKDKLGPGIDKIKIQETPYKNRGFTLFRKDGSFTDFSYIKCINHPTLLSKIKECCRHAIIEDIINFKQNMFSENKTIVCPITHKNIGYEDCQIHHDNPTFSKIMKRWLKNKKITEEQINKSKDNSYETYFTDKSLIIDFRDFHNSIANLRAISKEGHLKVLSKNEN